MNTNSRSFKEIKYIFWGTGHLAESAVAALSRAGNDPIAIVTKPDSKQGRDHTLTAPMIKKWALHKGIPVLQPEYLKVPSNKSGKYNDSDLQEISASIDQFVKSYKSFEADVAIVASYGKIIPKDILDIPNSKTLNIHPSALPLYRGPSPIQSAMLSGDESTAVSIMVLDEEMDHGPVLIQNVLNIHQSANAESLEIEAGQLGGELLVQLLEHYVNGNIVAKAQDHDAATFCKYITKEQGLIVDIFTQNTDEKFVISDEKKQEIIRKYKALYGWPGVYFNFEHNDKSMRVKISKVDLATGDIVSVIPEGKSEMGFESFKNGYK